MTEPPNLILIATLDEEREGWREGEGILHDAVRAQHGLPADGEAGASDRAFGPGLITPVPLDLLDPRIREDGNLE
jgi:hypothetical protein